MVTPLRQAWSGDYRFAHVATASTRPHASQFARDLIVQLTGHTLLRERSSELIPVDAPTHFTDPTPTSEMVRQILGATSQFEKASLGHQAAPGPRVGEGYDGPRCEGRRPVPAAVVAEARRLARKNPRTGRRRSLREIAAELAKLGHCGPLGKPYFSASVSHAGGVKSATGGSIISHADRFRLGGHTA